MRVAGMAVEDPPPLSRFLRLAVIAGIESAVRIHIDRGDDLNARDDKGRTPLMLSAARNRAAVCRLLLASGADASLVDQLGRDAFGIAQEAGALEAAAVISAACGPPPEACSEGGPGVPAPVSALESAAPPETETSSEHRPETERPEVGNQHARESGKVQTDRDIAAALGDGNDEFELAGWEAEDDPAPPVGDPTLTVAAVAMQSAFTDHRPVDTDADWGDLEALLPERATPLPRTDDIEGRQRLRMLLLRAIREGSISDRTIEELTVGNDGEPDAEAEAVLRRVVNDLGAETDERFEHPVAHGIPEVFIAPDEAPDEEQAITEAIASLDDLTSRRNEPFRFFQRDIQREALLTAEAEIALAQSMEDGLARALDALAAWPPGLSAVLAGAGEVASGTKALRWMRSALPDGGPLDNPAEGADSLRDAESVQPAGAEALADEVGNGPESGDDANAGSAELSAFNASVKSLSDLVLNANGDPPEWSACRASLGSLGLAGSFLLDLADSRVPEQSAPPLAFLQAVSAYRRARDRMVAANLRLTLSIAKKYLFGGQPLDDLLQEGNIGLVKAVDRFDWRKGFRFSTYATWWIRKQIGRFLADMGRTIRLPVHVHLRAQQVALAEREFEQRHGLEPSVDQVAALVEMPAWKVAALVRMGLEPLPLHEVSDIDDLITAEARDQWMACDPMTEVEAAQTVESVNRILGTLRPREADVLRMRHGFGIPDGMTLEEIGVQLNLTRERIRQIEAKAVRRLKHPSRKERLAIELGLRPSPQSTLSSIDAADDLGSDLSTWAADPEPASEWPEPRRNSTSSVTDTILAEAGEAGIAVADCLTGSERGSCFHSAEASDCRSLRIVRQPEEIGIECRPRNGYRR